MKNNKGRFNKNKKSSTSLPEIVIVNSYNDPDESEQAVMEYIEKNIVDESKLREFDCIFASPDFDTANELSIYLKERHNYKIINLFPYEREWDLHAIKQIVVKELRTTLMIAKVESVGHNSQLVDWNFEIDQSPDKSE
jgi:hypothetical protein